jgi:hypothetical protein
MNREPTNDPRTQVPMATSQRTPPNSASSSSGKTVGVLSIVGCIAIAMIARIPSAMRKHNEREERNQHYSAPQRPVISDQQVAEMEQAVRDGKAGSAIQRLMGKHPDQKK